VHSCSYGSIAFAIPFDFFSLPRSYSAIDMIATAEFQLASAGAAATTTTAAPAKMTATPRTASSSASRRRSPVVVAPPPLLVLLAVVLVVGAAAVQAQQQQQPPKFEGTSLERVMTRAYQARIRDGTWRRVFGNSASSDLMPQPFCNGDVDAWSPDDAQEGDNVLADEQGTDLARVVETGVFTCGFLSNAKFEAKNPFLPEENATTLLIETGVFVDLLITGALVEYWESLVSYLSDVVGKEIDLQWNLFETEQTLFERLRDGNVDALCGSFAPDAKYLMESVEDPSEFVDGKEAMVTYAPFSFRVMTCPSYLKQAYYYLRGDSGITTVEELRNAIATGRVSLFCVAGFKTEPTVWDSLDQGFCQAVYDGVPPANNSYVAIPAPLLQSPVSYFRSKDLPSLSSDGTGDASSAESSLKATTTTTLETAVTRAYLELVDDSTWSNLFGGLQGVEGTDFCNAPGGNNAQFWPTPTEVHFSETFIWYGTWGFREMCDVSTRSFPSHAVLSLIFVSSRFFLLRLVLILIYSGYTQNVTFSAAGGEILIDTVGGADSIQGLIPEFWRTLVNDNLSVRYERDPALRLEWALYPTSQDVFTALQAGDIDAACGYWLPDASWIDPSSGATLARPLAFSMMHCPSFYETLFVYTLASGSIDSFRSLLDAAAAFDGAFNVCVQGAPTLFLFMRILLRHPLLPPLTLVFFRVLYSSFAELESGGFASSCQTALDNYLPGGNHKCIGAPLGTSDARVWAFRSLSTGDCSAIWGGTAPSNPTLYNAFEQPRKLAASTFFRTFDYIRSDETPTAGPDTGAPGAPAPSPSGESSSGRLKRLSLVSSLCGLISLLLLASASVTF